MALIVVTGGIGAGKTTVLARFKQLGGEVLDADDTVHSLYQRNSFLYQAIQKRWGNTILTQDGMPDRNKIAQVVFQSEQELKWLNSLLHPLVKEIIQSAARRCPSGLYCAIPLFFECGWEEPQAVFSIGLWCDPQTQRNRLLQRGWSDQQIQARLKQQLSMDEKLRRSDFGIISNCSWKNLYRQCDVIYQSIQQHLHKFSD
ncbi:MAG: dephospho-CoA kinase [Lentisphaeria bacterium]